MQPTVAIIGVGLMGGAIARRLLERGWTVCAHDIEPSRLSALRDAGARTQPWPALATAAHGLTIVCVVDAAQTRAALWGAHDGIGSPAQAGAAATMAPGHTVMLCPTIGPHDTEAIAQRLGAQGLRCIDAPMSGGPARAREGSMSLMLACERALAQQHASLIEAMSSHVFHVSERVGDGARTKLVNNLLAAINLVGAAEVMVLAQRLGLDPAATLGVIEQSSGQSWIGSDRLRRVLAGDRQARAHMTLLKKDAGLALQAAAQAGMHAPLGALAAGVFERAVQAGLADADDAAVLDHLQRELLQRLPTIPG